MLSTLLASARAPTFAPELRGFLAAHAAEHGDRTPIARAFLGGARADRLGFAFVAGYRAALEALVPDRPSELSTLAALCATEVAGNHPRAIETTLEGGKLRGHKKWITLGGAAETLLVVAKVGEADGRPQLSLAAVRADAPGVRVTALPETPFVPEVPHAEAHFEDVEVTYVFPGDGYADYLKPFRTVEDLHVHAAFLGYALRATLAAADEEGTERLLAVVAAVEALAGTPTASITTHLALAGVIASTNDLVARLESTLTAADPRFPRDRALLLVAGKARTARRETAWRALTSADAPGVVPSSAQ